MNEISLPEQIEVRSPDGKETLSVPNAFSGSIVLPETWLGADFQAHFEAGRKDDEAGHPWQRQWQWAKARVMEWRIEGLPTNPNQIEDGDLPLALQRWIYRQAHQAMQAYQYEEADAVRSRLAFPSAADLTADEFFAWEKVWHEIDEDGDDERAGLLRSWTHARLLVRDWGDVGRPEDETGLRVDLGLITAVTGQALDLIGKAMSLGNWPGPRGEH